MEWLVLLAVILILPWAYAADRYDQQDHYAYTRFVQRKQRSMRADLRRALGRKS